MCNSPIYSNCLKMLNIDHIFFFSRFLTYSEDPDQTAPTIV